MNIIKRNIYVRTKKANIETPDRYEQKEGALIVAIKDHKTELWYSDRHSIYYQFIREATEEELYRFNQGATNITEFKLGDLVRPFYDDLKRWNSWIDEGEIIKLGGVHYEDYNKGEGFGAICRQHSNGTGMSVHLNLRHCTMEEINHYLKVGIGANVRDIDKDIFPNDYLDPIIL